MVFWDLNTNSKVHFCNYSLSGLSKMSHLLYLEDMDEV